MDEHSPTPDATPSPQPPGEEGGLMALYLKASDKIEKFALLAGFQNDEERDEVEFLKADVQSLIARAAKHGRTNAFTEGWDSALAHVAEQAGVKGWPPGHTLPPTWEAADLLKRLHSLIAHLKAPNNQPSELPAIAVERARRTAKLLYGSTQEDPLFALLVARIAAARCIGLVNRLLGEEPESILAGLEALVANRRTETAAKGPPGPVPPTPGPVQSDPRPTPPPGAFLPVPEIKGGKLGPGYGIRCVHVPGNTEASAEGGLDYWMPHGWEPFHVTPSGLGGWLVWLRYYRTEELPVDSGKP